MSEDAKRVIDDTVHALLYSTSQHTLWAPNLKEQRAGVCVCARVRL